MQKIEISQSNVFDEKAKTFSNTQLAQRLQEKYRAKPYEERRKNLYYLSLILSFFCNGLAIVASASFVFAFIYALVHSFMPYPIFVAIGITMLLLCIVEFAKRETTPELFKDIFQYGFKSSYFIRIFAIFGLISLSTLFSYKGGHDFVELVMKTPSYEAPQEKDNKEIQERYKAQIQQAKENAESFKKSRTWKGKLAEHDSKQYEKLLLKVTALSEQQNKETQSINEQNKIAVEHARKDFESSTEQYKSKLESRGTGFAMFSIFGEIVFIFCVWFMERFDFKTATQYAVLQQTENTTTEATQEKEKEHKQQSQVKVERALPYSEPKQDGQVIHNSITSDIKQENTLPIGFYQNGREQAEKLLQQVTQQTTEATQQPSMTKVVLDDRYTILHKGSKTTQRYTLARINNIITTYQERIYTANEKGKIVTAERNKKTLQYWQGRKQELLQKIG